MEKLVWIPQSLTEDRFLYCALSDALYDDHNDDDDHKDDDDEMQSIVQSGLAWLNAF